jgi:hypothetical protein
MEELLLIEEVKTQSLNFALEDILVYSVKPASYIGIEKRDGETG